MFDAVNWNESEHLVLIPDNRMDNKNDGLDRYRWLNYYSARECWKAEVPESLLGTGKKLRYFRAAKAEPFRIIATLEKRPPHQNFRVRGGKFIVVKSGR